MIYYKIHSLHDLLQDPLPPWSVTSSTASMICNKFHCLHDLLQDPLPPGSITRSTPSRIYYKIHSLHDLLQDPLPPWSVTSSTASRIYYKIHSLHDLLQDPLPQIKMSEYDMYLIKLRHRFKHQIEIYRHFEQIETHNIGLLNWSEPWLTLQRPQFGAHNDEHRNQWFNRDLEAMAEMLNTEEVYIDADRSKWSWSQCSHTQTEVSGLEASVLIHRQK